ncbi:MAG: protein phosphatase 2C domain-containing protein [Bacteroidales bacterium]|nr:protein phosphatase 2C domain-containing protein [Bacteroidales bacterium]
MNIRISKPSCYTAQGRKPNQEDALFPPCGKADQKTRVFMICDGMGGHEKGEVASACVAESIGKATARQPLCSVQEMKGAIEHALQVAYRNLDSLDTSDTAYKMGTTLALLAVCTDGVVTAHIGDSRVYQLRPNEGVVFKTRDHSLVNDLIAAGELTEQEARDFPQRNVITRAIQPHQEYPAKASYNILTDIREGDVFFICCDGVIEQLDDDDLCQYLLSGQPLVKRMEKIEEECLKRNTRDNNTAYLIEVKEVKGRGNDVIATVCGDNEAEITQVPMLRKRWWQSPRLWMMVSVMVIAMLVAFIFMAASGNRKKERQQEEPRKEQVQGTVKRQNK